MTAPVALIILGSAILGALPFAVAWRAAREDSDYWFGLWREEMYAYDALYIEHSRRAQPRDEKGRFIKAAELRGDA